MSMIPIAYTYEADYHCPDCTRERFGAQCRGKDHEGNYVAAVFDYDEWYSFGEGNQTLACGTCGGILDQYEEEG